MEVRQVWEGALLSHATEVRDTDGRENEVGTDWELGVMDLTFNLLGQAQTFILTPPQITKNGKEMHNEKKTKAVWKLEVWTTLSTYWAKPKPLLIILPNLLIRRGRVTRRKGSEEYNDFVSH